MIDFEKARAETLKYHKAYYSRFKLFEDGSWLAHADEPLMALLSYLEGTIEILDLGCGVGRNAIPMAQELLKQNKQARITGVDILVESIDLLNEYARLYKVEGIIKGVLADNDEFVLAANQYDLIAAISTLEHSQDKSKVLALMNDIAGAVKHGGFVRIEMTTNRKVVDALSGEQIATFVETPLDRIEVEEMLNQVFAGWNVITKSIDPYEETLVKDQRSVNWSSTQINFTAQKP